MAYVILSEESLTELQNNVNEFIAHGWKPIGGVAISNVYVRPDNEMEREYCQSMIKEEQS